VPLFLSDASSLPPFIFPPPFREIFSHTASTSRQTIPKGWQNPKLSPLPLAYPSPSSKNGCHASPSGKTCFHPKRWCYPPLFYNSEPVSSFYLRIPNFAPVEPPPNSEVCIEILFRTASPRSSLSPIYSPYYPFASICRACNCTPGIPLPLAPSLYQVGIARAS